MSLTVSDLQKKIERIEKAEAQRRASRKRTGGVKSLSWFLLSCALFALAGFLYVNKSAPEPIVKTVYVPQPASAPVEETVNQVESQRIRRPRRTYQSCVCPTYQPETYVPQEVYQPRYEAPSEPPRESQPVVESPVVQPQFSPSPEPKEFVTKEAKKGNRVGRFLKSLIGIEDKKPKPQVR